ncbi:MAG: NADH-quinone oxidoreductase subunit K [Granulosicoccus sp.]
MELLFGLLTGVLMAGGVWLILSRNLVRFLFGLVLISNVANLVIFASGGVVEGRPPLIGDSGVVAGVANSLPQALVLTAIVIGFGLVSFTLTLALRSWQAIGTTNVEDMSLSEQRHGETDGQGGARAVGESRR